MIAEGADQGSPVLPQYLRLQLGAVGLHEGEMRSLLPLRLGVEHSGETQLRVKTAKEAVEGGSIWSTVCRISGGR